MENPEEHQSVRDPDWHPRGSPRREPELGLMAKVELKQKIKAEFPPVRVNELYRQEGLKIRVPEDSPEPEKDVPPLDPLKKAELETRIAAFYPPERMDKLFKQEGVSKKDSVNRSLKRKILDLLKI
jgi:hypothetical protein